MTKRIERIRELGAERARLAARDAELYAEIAELIREELQAPPPHESGPAIAEAAGLSVPRVYQIRDGRR